MVPPLTLCAYMKKGPNLRWSLIQCSGGDEGDRTPDLLTASQALSRLVGLHTSHPKKDISCKNILPFDPCAFTLGIELLYLFYAEMSRPRINCSTLMLNLIFR